jgi:inorganic phosphate transporter, PiT family
MHLVEIWDNLGRIPYFQLPLVVWLLILLALTFDFLNGFHDTANSIATVVTTRVLSPQVAVLWAAFFNFVAFLVFSTRVAATIGQDIIDPQIVDNSVIAATLVAACGWNLLTWYLGLPTSSSHALIGGMVGAALLKATTVWLWMPAPPAPADMSAALGGAGAWAAASPPFPLKWSGLGTTVAFIVLAPLIGLVTGVLIATAVHWIFRRASPRSVDKFFRRGQLVSAALYSLGHGGNDAQKTMGIILLLLIAASQGGSRFATPETVPTEVVLGCHLAMGLGTLFGGWRIVKTMGQKIIRLRPVDGFSAEAGAAATLALTIFGGIPVSTTHTITGAIVGVGVMKRVSAVRWGVAGRVVWAWVLTIPGAAILAAVTWLLLHGLSYAVGGG